MSEDENTPATDDALAADASGEREPTAEEATDAAATEAAAGVPVAGEPVAGSVSEAAAAESVEGTATARETRRAIRVGSWLQ